MPQDTQQQQSNMLDQDQSRAALGVITYLMTHTLPPSQMQSKAEPNQQVQQHTEQAAPQESSQAPQKPQQDPTSELKGQMDGMKTETDAKIQSIVEGQQKQIDQLKEMIQKILEEDQNEPQPPSQAPTNL